MTSIVVNALSLTVMIAAFLAIPAASIQINNRCIVNEKATCYDSQFGVILAMMIVGIIAIILSISYFGVLPFKINGGCGMTSHENILNENYSDQISVEPHQLNNEINLRTVNIEIASSENINNNLHLNPSDDDNNNISTYNDTNDTIQKF